MVQLIEYYEAHHDTQQYGEQHRLEEAAYHRGSPWRYNDILRRVIRAMNKTSADRRDST
jgi:5-deoxy-D-glucuronate isomerase